MRSLTGLGDLARLLRALPAADHDEAAALLGLRRAATPGKGEGEGGGAGLRGGGPTRDLPPELVAAAAAAAAAADDAATAAAGAAAGPPARAAFFRVVAATETAPAVPRPQPPEPGLTREDLASAPRAPLPPQPPLAPWAALGPRLADALRSARPGREPDIAALTRTWARGESLARIPRRPRRTWAAAAALWVDRSGRLTPFWADQDLVYQHLVRLCGAAAIRPRVLDSHLQSTLAAWGGDLVGPERPDPAVPVLVLGDLGFHGTATDRARWLRTAQRLRREGVRVAALVPCPVGRWDREVARAWNATPWERASAAGDHGAPHERAEALLRLLGPTALAQPGLLRALRQILPAAAADASTEADVWRHADVQAADTSGLVLRKDASARWRARFAAEVPPAQKAEVRALIDRWHGRWRAELMHAETLAWEAHGNADADPPGQPALARAFVKRLAATLRAEGGPGAEIGAVKQYGRHLLGPFPDEGYARLAAELPELKQIWSLAYEGVADAQLPGTIAPSELYRRPSAPSAPRLWAVHQRGESLVLVPAESWSSPPDGEPGSPAATITAAAPEVWVRRGGESRSARTWLAPSGAAVRAEAGAREPARVEIPLTAGEPITLHTDCGEVTLEPWERPPWAVAAGRDRYGLWAAFEVAGVQQRLRWIPPGTFTMGSPGPEAKAEAGRDADETQHAVTLTRGYWLGETPVTQALWVAVMGERGRKGKNPSYFVSEDRPVEQVSWDDCQRFLQRLGRKLEGFEPRLPTEAEWERACRAGTTTATWVGDLTLRGDNDAPELDAIAWYGGNSGEDFELELENGYDSSAWPEKQYPHTRAGTHPVGRKAANPYGLHDMLGNVWEWCQDTTKGLPEPYPAAPAVDPVQTGPGSYRVFRGGAWISDAWHVRAASRGADPRGVRVVVLGFRLAGGQESAPRPPAGEPRSGGQGRGA